MYKYNTDNLRVERTRQVYTYVDIQACNLRLLDTNRSQSVFFSDIMSFGFNLLSPNSYYTIGTRKRTPVLIVLIYFRKIVIGRSILRRGKKMKNVVFLLISSEGKTRYETHRPVHPNEM